MKPLSRNPVLALVVLGALSGALGTLAPGWGHGDAPRLGIYMVLTGIWFGLVVAFGVWHFASRSLGAVATTIAATWFGWQVAVNLAMQITENWLKTAALSDSVAMSVAGVSAGAVGAVLTWAGAAASAPMLRQTAVAVTVISTGALLGLLLPWTNQFDNPAILLVPWQAGVAAVIGYGLTRREAIGPPSAIYRAHRT
ncbi:MAG: hypothetical protein AB7L90_21850 [Hyphomicrobiaceae bacterium]